MAKVLLTSEKFVKEHTNIDDNMSGAYLGPAIRETQDIELTMYLGANLVAKLQSLVEDGSISDTANTIYKAVLEQAQYFLAYGAISKVIPITSVKISNFGASQANDENIRTLGIEEIATVEGWYQRKADSYARKLLKFVLDNRQYIPEIDETCACGMKAHLTSSASSGLWLGGPRGRIFRTPEC